MQKPLSNSFLLALGGIIILALSIPLEWMTLHNANIQMSGFPSSFNNHHSNFFGGTSVVITGINGSLTLLVKAPIWLIVSVAIIGVLISLLNSIQITSVPRYIPIILVSITTIYVFSALAVAKANSATLGIGVFLALIGIALSYLSIFKYKKIQPELGAYRDNARR